MTTFIEDQLTEAMHEQVADIVVSGDLVGHTLRRERRRTTITRAAYAGSVVGLAGVLTAGVLATRGNSPTVAPNRHSAAAHASPHMRLAAAVSTTRTMSYHVKNTAVVQTIAGHPTVTVEGAFDPTTATGYARMISVDGTGWQEERLVDGDLYRGDAFPGQPILWQHDRGKHTNLTYDLTKVGALVVSADPRQLLGALTDSGATVTQTASNTYHFVAAIPPRRGLVGGNLTGDVTLDSNGRIAKVVYEATLHGTPTDNTVLDGTLELSDYGAPVTVDRPPGIFEDLPGK